jgi:hypothetical protein
MNIKKSTHDEFARKFTHQSTLTKIKDQDAAYRKKKKVKDRLNVTTTFPKKSNLNVSNADGQEDRSLSRLKKKIGFGQIEKVGYFWGRKKSDFDINL